MNRSSPRDIITDVSDATLDACVLDLVSESLSRLTPFELKRRIRQAYRPIERGRVELSIRRLVEQKALVYTYQFGNSFLEPSFEKPVRVTESIVLKPPACDYDLQPNDIVLTIKAGAAFGTGCHPTTRLCLRGLEKVAKDGSMPTRKTESRVLDIGTGSGVLLIAALKMGCTDGIGLDIDPCARAEATENTALNEVSKQMEISDCSLESLEGPFFLITANLRLPTLIAYFNTMAHLTESGGFIIISGIKANEINSIKDISGKFGMAVYWEGIERGWGGLALHLR